MTKREQPVGQCHCIPNGPHHEFRENGEGYVIACTVCGGQAQPDFDMHLAYAQRAYTRWRRPITKTTPQD
jgi:hypothetical protein